MDYKKILKTIFLAVIVPGGTVVIAFYGMKFGKKKYDEWQIKRLAEKENFKADEGNETK